MTTEPKGAERRQFERKQFSVEVYFEGGEIVGAARTRDIGIGGLYMATVEDLPVHLPLKMRLRINKQELEINGVVIYVERGEGVGIRFQNLPADAEAVLRRELPAFETANVNVRTK